MSKKIFKIQDFQPDVVSLTCPTKKTNNTRFSDSNLPMLQTCEMTYSYDGANIEILCTPDHADIIHTLDQLICTTICENSKSWFNQDISYDNIERMYRPTLQGNKNPRQILKASSFKAFDSNTKMTENFPPKGSGIFIIQLDGVKFEQKVCEAQWSIIQAKECTLDSSPPMFIQ
jgi:hypothetical protein